MQVFKFGGASVKDATSVKNVLDILKRYPDDYLVVVISAMGKTTNRLEAIIDAARQTQQAEFQRHLDEFKAYHQAIVSELFPAGNNLLQAKIDAYYKDLNAYYSLFEIDHDAEYYDTVIRFGELISTRIVAAYLNDCNLPTDWVDASSIIKTDNHFKSATVDLELTKHQAIIELLPRFVSKKIVVTQGFIGRGPDQEPTTLGREGSDYSGAIFAYCLNAESLTIWKDVEGMYNADPKKFPNAQKLDAISYKDAIELSYYGASVIHPKTIQPLQNKEIPLYVKSFLDPALSGTAIKKDAFNTIPCYIIKDKQVLVSLSTKNFSFIAEKNLAEIFNKYDQLDMKINIMQNSAVNFSALFDAAQFDELAVLNAFQSQYQVRYNEHLELITIRHFNEEVVSALTHGKDILLVQKTRETVRFVVKNK